MKVPREWMECPDVFNIVSEALFNIDPDEAQVQAREEPDGYGGQGYIDVQADGHIYRLDLYEIDPHYAPNEPEDADCSPAGPVG